MLKGMLILSATVLLISSTVVPRVDPIDSHAPLVFQVQITNDALTRWSKIVPLYVQPLAKLLDYVEYLPIPKQLYDNLDQFANYYQHQDFVREVRAVAELSGLPFKKLFFVNFLYEFSKSKACTGIIARSSTGEILHARNMDFDMWQLLSKLAAKVEYMHGDDKVFTADYYIGSVFVHTGIRHGAFTIEANSRESGTFQQILDNIFKKNYIPTTWLVRRVLTEETTYESAVKRLMQQNVTVTVYLIVSGIEPNQGIIIQKDMEFVHGTEQLTDEKWFLVQTNYDRDQREPVTDARRVPAERRMVKRGNRDLKLSDLMTELMEWPNFMIATIITVSMSAQRGYHNTTVWYGHNPDKVQEPALTEEE